MKPLLLMLHGWGFDRHFWRELQERLADHDSLAWDLGFYGAPMMAPPESRRRLVAIGHSYGLLWLLRNRPVTWDGLISINGFPRFAATEDFPQGIDPRQVQRLSATVAEAPWAALAGFRQRCGDDTPPPETVDEAQLQASLGHLLEWDQRPAEVDLALCGEADKVVPPSLSRAAFAPEIIAWHKGGHLLPLEDPDWCARQVRDWLEARP
jgi:pimeloyl-[acyl-carrier protein] methyl ester esterase